MELVKLVMEIYYNLIRLQELEDNNFADNNNKSENNFNSKENSNSNNKNGTNSRSPQSAYYANHSNNIEQQQRATSRVHNAHQQNDNIYMNNSGLNSSFSEMKQNINHQQHQQQHHQQQQKQQKPAPTNNSKLIASTIQNMESFNLNDNETVSNDYINRLIDEINKNSNRRGNFHLIVKNI